MKVKAKEQRNSSSSPGLHPSTLIKQGARNNTCQFQQLTFKNSRYSSIAGETATQSCEASYNTDIRPQGSPVRPSLLRGRTCHRTPASSRSPLQPPSALCHCLLSYILGESHTMLEYMVTLVHQALMSVILVGWCRERRVLGIHAVLGVQVRHHRWFTGV